MAELRESSGLHSLASLREHEKRRAREQAEAAHARAQAEQHARQEAERAAARLEQERRLAERVALEYAESAQRAELARLETAQLAEFERAEGLLRASAELKSQLEDERKARRSVELGLTSRLLRQRLWTSVSAALCVGSGAYRGWVVLRRVATECRSRDRGGAAIAAQRTPSSERGRAARGSLNASRRRTQLAHQLTRANLARRTRSTVRAAALSERPAKTDHPRTVVPTAGQTV